MSCISMTLMLSTSRQRPVWSLAALIISAGVFHRAFAPWCARGCGWADSKFVGLWPSPCLGPFLGPKSRSLRLAQNHETLVDASQILQRLVEQKEAATLVQIPGENPKGLILLSPFTVIRWVMRLVHC